MPKVRFIESKSILTKSRLPGIDYVINPYTGCEHSCVYCYADFMKRFTSHKERWGKFVDVKTNASERLVEQINKLDLKGKKILISSVTDPYQSLEKKYKITKEILNILAYSKAKIEILTKSNLIVRDLKILKKIKDLKVGVSISVLDRKKAKLIEPFAPSPQKRITALRKLHTAGIKTYLFHSPILPYLSETDQIIDATKDYVNFFMFENLNLSKQSVRGKFFKFLKNNFPDFIEKYNKIYSTKYYTEYWKYVEKLVKHKCKSVNKKAKLFFHTKSF